MTCGIYKIENKINGKLYIGQSVNIEKRWCDYYRLPRHKKEINNMSDEEWENI